MNKIKNKPMIIIPIMMISVNINGFLKNSFIILSFDKSLPSAEND